MSTKDYFVSAVVTIAFGAATWWWPPVPYPLGIGLALPAIVVLTVLPPWRPPTVMGVTAATLALAGANAGRIGTPWLMPLACMICGVAMFWAGLTGDTDSAKRAALAKALLVSLVIIAILLVPYLSI